MPEERKDVLLPLLFPAILVVVLTMIKLFEATQDLSLYTLGIHPREVDGLLGIITAPLIHGDWQHLLSNASPIMVLGWMLGYFYPRAFMGVVLHGWWMTGLLVWLTANNAWHIGASGVVYAWAVFLLVGGLLRKERRRSVAVAIIVVLYGSLVWGLMPGLEGISWESHLAGTATGLLLALAYRNYDLPEPEEDPFRDEEEEEETGTDYTYKG